MYYLCSGFITFDDISHLSATESAKVSQWETAGGYVLLPAHAILDGNEVGEFGLCRI